MLDTHPVTFIKLPLVALNSGPVEHVDNKIGILVSGCGRNLSILYFHSKWKEMFLQPNLSKKDHYHRHHRRRYNFVFIFCFFLPISSLYLLFYFLFFNFPYLLLVFPHNVLNWAERLKNQMNGHTSRMYKSGSCRVSRCFNSYLNVKSRWRHVWRCSETGKK